jgi:F420-0:gamma-glutamyl ligase
VNTIRQVIKREGMIPTILGAIVSASAATLLRSRYKKTATGVLGFGLAHVVLGAIDLFGRKKMWKAW